MSEDVVNHPSHYTRFKGIEVIQLTEQLNFCKGNAVKYIARAGAKDKSKEIEDLEKARWYIDREIERLKDEDEDEAWRDVNPDFPNIPNGEIYVGKDFPRVHVQNVSTTAGNTVSLVTYRTPFDKLKESESV